MGYDSLLHAILNLSPQPSRATLHRCLDLAVEGDFESPVAAVAAHGTHTIRNEHMVAVFFAALRAAEPQLQVILPSPRLAEVLS